MPSNILQLEECAAKVLVDGEAYFRSVAHALERAELEVFIQGWWVSRALVVLNAAAVVVSLRWTGWTRTD